MYISLVEWFDRIGFKIGSEGNNLCMNQNRCLTCFDNSYYVQVILFEINYAIFTKIYMNFSVYS